MLTIREAVEYGVALLTGSTIIGTSLYFFATMNTTINNFNSTGLNNSATYMNPAIVILFEVLIPVIGIISIALYFIHMGKKKKGE